MVVLEKNPKKFTLKKNNQTTKHAKLRSRQRGTVKPVLNDHSQKDHKLVLKTIYRLIQVKNIFNNRLMQVKSIAKYALLLTFIKLPFVIVYI